ncbi:aminotransferase class III-fold pyridoxal phosphate-dependent enzyme [Shigella flexneri]
MAAIHGFDHPQLNAAMKSQIDAMSHVMFGGVTMRQPLSCAGTGGDDAATAGVRFSRGLRFGSGEVAMKMALQYWQAKGEARRVF